MNVLLRLVANCSLTAGWGHCNNCRLSMLQLTGWRCGASHLTLLSPCSSLDNLYSRHAPGLSCCAFRMRATRHFLKFALIFALCVQALAGTMVQPTHAPKAMVATVQGDASNAGSRSDEGGRQRGRRRRCHRIRAGGRPSPGRQHRRRRIHALSPSGRRSPLPRLPREGARRRPPPTCISTRTAT